MSDKKTVTITVRGEANTGKTTIASIIFDALHEAGIETVNVVDKPNLIGYMREAVAKKIKVKIVQQQVQAERNRHEQT